MRDHKTEKEDYDYLSSTGRCLGFICGIFFSIIGLFAGFLYPTMSMQREDFICGWIKGFRISFIIAVIILVLVVFVV